MLKITKLTDYGIGLMARLARSASVEPITARDLAAGSGLPLPTVSKLLKLLSGHDLLSSTRGAAGGYVLARRPDEISLVDMVEALQGSMALTECAGNDDCLCDLESSCGLRANWNWINNQLLDTLRGITLHNMAGSVARDLHTLENNKVGF